MCLNSKLASRDKIGITGNFMIELMTLCVGNYQFLWQASGWFYEKKYFIELVGKLQAIRKNIDKYYPDERERVQIVTFTRRVLLV